MQPLARTAAGVMIAASLVLHAPASAQTPTPDEFYEALLDAVDTEFLRALLQTLADLPAENEVLVIEHMAGLMTDRAYADHIYELLGDNRDLTGEEALAAGIAVGLEIAGKGILRLPPARQRTFLEFGRFAIRAAVKLNPEICARLMLGTADPLEAARIDYAAYGLLSPEELGDMLGIYREAVAAEVEDRPAVVPVTADEIAAGAEALQAVFAELIAVSPLWQRIAAAPTVEAVAPVDLCRASGTAFDALDLLDEPEWNWAFAAIMTEQF